MTMTTKEALTIARNALSDALYTLEDLRKVDGMFTPAEHCILHDVEALRDALRWKALDA